MVNQKYMATHADAFKAIANTISQEASLEQSLRSFQAGAQASGGQGSSNRTAASPDWDGQPPLNWKKNLSLTGISIADFDASNTYLRFVLHFFVSLFGYPKNHQKIPKGFHMKSLVCTVWLRLDASCNLGREPSVQAVLTSLGSLWLLNRTSEAKTIPYSELFGFNTGSFVEVQSGLGFQKTRFQWILLQWKVVSFFNPWYALQIQ